MAVWERMRWFTMGSDGYSRARAEHDNDKIIMQLQDFLWVDPENLLPQDRGLLDEDFDELGSSPAASWCYVDRGYGDRYRYLPDIVLKNFVVGLPMDHASPRRRLLLCQLRVRKAVSSTDVAGGNPDRIVNCVI